MENTSRSEMRILCYIIGLNLIATAVVLNIRLNVGVAAFSTVMYAISEIYHLSLSVSHLLSAI